MGHLDPSQAFAQFDPNAPTTTAPTDPSASSGAMPLATAVGTGSKSKTIGGIPTKLNEDINITTGPDSSAKVPNYVAGDEFLPIHDPNPDNVRSLQTQLIEAGLLKIADVHFGLWDDKSAKAFAKVLGQANASGVPYPVALQNYVATGASSLQAKAIDPYDLKAMANQVANNVLGTNLNDEQLARFDAAFNAATIGGTGPKTSAGQDELTTTLLKQENPNQAKEQSVRGTGQRILAMLHNRGPSTSGSGPSTSGSGQ